MSRVDFAKNLADNRRAALMAECQDCGYKCPASELEDIADFEERVAPGEDCPAGECPKCGALAHIIEPDRLSLAEIIAGLERAESFLRGFEDDDTQEDLRPVHAGIAACDAAYNLLPKLVEAVRDLAAMSENMLLHEGRPMPVADKTARRKTLAEARALLASLGVKS